MYGSSEKRGKPSSELTHIWNYIDENILKSNNNPIDIPLEEAFVPQNHAHVLQQVVNPEIFKKKQQRCRSLVTAICFYRILAK